MITAISEKRRGADVYTRCACFVHSDDCATTVSEESEFFFGGSFLQDLSVSKRIIASFLLTLGPLLWAGNFVVGRAVHEIIDPLALNFLRWVIAGILVTPFLLIHRRVIREEFARNGRNLVTLALLGVVGFNWVLYAGLARSEGTVAAIVFAVTPFLILLIAAVSTGRKISTSGVIGSIGAFFGVVLVFWDPRLATSGSGGGVGPALVFVSAVIWAFYTVKLQTSCIQLPAVAAFATTVWLGLLALTPIALVSGQLTQIFTAPPEVFLAAAYLGAGASVLAFCSWHAGIARVGAANAAIFMQLVPFFAVILSALFLGETLHGPKLAGLIIITLCFLFTQIRWRSARHAESDNTMARVDGSPE